MSTPSVGSTLSDEEFQEMQASIEQERQHDFHSRYADATDWRVRLNIIRLAYNFHMPRILESARTGKIINPYIVSWQFTDLQDCVWSEVRGIGLPFYPLFPIQQFYADFADPARKIVLDIEGIAMPYPAELERVKKREQAFLADGWEIHTISSSTVRRLLHDVFDEDYANEIEEAINSEYPYSDDNAHYLRDAKTTLDGYLLYLRRLRYHQEQPPETDEWDEA